MVGNGAPIDPFEFKAELKHKMKSLAEGTHVQEHLACSTGSRVQLLEFEMSMAVIAAAAAVVLRWRKQRLRALSAA